MTNSLRIRQRWPELLPVALLLGIYLAFPSLARQSQDHAVTEDHNKPKVKITAIKRALDPGDTLRLHVEILNGGATTLLISKEIASPCGEPSRLDVAILKGPTLEGPGEACAMDYEIIGPYKPDAARDLRRLVDGWIALPPGYSYARDVSSYSLRKTGRYLICTT
jgi:hypothetical protein